MNLKKSFNTDKSKKETNKIKDYSFKSLNLIIKKGFKWIGITYLPAMLAIILLTCLVMTFIYWLNPHQSETIIHHYNANYQVKGGIIDLLLQSIGAVLYSIFIYPIGLILENIQIVVDFLAGGTIFTEFLKNESTIWIYLGVILSISVLIGFIMLSANGIRAMVSKTPDIHIGEGSKMLLFSIIIIPLIPIFFIGINTVINTITNAFLEATGVQSKNIALIILNSSFNSKIGNWTFIPPTVPDLDFNFILCLFGEVMMCYIMFMITMYLFWRVAELCFLLIISPIPVVWGYYDGGISLNKWKDSVISKFMGGFGLFVAYSFYLSSMSVIVSISSGIKDSQARGVFNIIGISSYGVMVIMSPTIFTNLLSLQSSIRDNMATMMSQRIASNTFKEGSNKTGLATAWASKGINLGKNISNEKGIKKSLIDYGFSKAQSKETLNHFKTGGFKRDKDIEKMKNFLNGK